VGGHERAEQPVVELGVEDAELDAVGDQDVGIGALGFQYAPVDGAGLVLKLAQSPAPEPAEFP